MTHVAIFDYGAGNIFSLKNSLEKIGATVDVITSFDDANIYSGLFLPGVGNFDPAMNSIRNFSKTKFRDYVGSMPVLGICLGMEMFFEKSEEGVEKGFNVIDGEIVVLPSTMKVPHMGWNNLEIIKETHPILKNITEKEQFYFVHSYYLKTKNNSEVYANTNYNHKIPAVIARDNYVGVQFHPEKSSYSGQKLISNWLNWKI